MSEYSILLSGTIKGSRASRASLFSVKYMGNKNKCQSWTGIFDCKWLLLLPFNNVFFMNWSNISLSWKSCKYIVIITSLCLIPHSSSNSFYTILILTSQWMRGKESYHTESVLYWRGNNVLNDASFCLAIKVHNLPQFHFINNFVAINNNNSVIY